MRRSAGFCMSMKRLMGGLILGVSLGGRLAARSGKACA